MKATTVLVGGVAAAFAATSIYFYQQLELERGRADSQTALLDRANATIASIRSSAPSPAAVLSASQQEPRSITRAPSAPESIQSHSQASTASAVAAQGERTAVKLPKSSLDILYGDLIKSLNLSAADAAKLLDVLGRKHSDLRGIQMNQTDLLEKSRAINDAEARVSKEIASLLGDGARAKYEEYQQTTSERMSVKQLQGQLAMTGAKNLSASQEKDLFDIFVAEKSIAQSMVRNDVGGPATYGDRLRSMEDYNARVLARSRDVLSPEQHAQLESRLHQQMQHARAVTQSLSQNKL
jgi:hypothetical protein